MARIFDVVDYPNEMRNEIVHRFPERGIGDYRMGSQVIVRESQNAVFFRDGQALDKFREILDAQSGDGNLKPSDIPVGEHHVEILSPSSGWIVQIDNVKIAEIARTAGCTKDKGAGIVFLKKKDAVKRGESIIRIYSSSESRLSAAEGKFAKLNPITIEGMLIGRV